MFVLCVLVWAASPAQARPKGKFTLGAGLASQSVSGDLDGSRVYYADPAVGPYVYAGKLESGTGGLLMGGITVSDSIGVEGLLINTSHDASHVGLPGIGLTANVTGLLAGIRLMLPMGDAFELFGRGTAGIYTVKFDNNTELPPSPLLQESTFSGIGIGVGGGIAMFFDPIGLEIGALAQKGSLDNLSGGGVEGSISSADLSIVTLTAILTVHFGGP